MSRGYRLTDGSVRSINATIRTVNQMRKTGIAGDLPFRQNARRQPAGATLQIGKTTAEWIKGTDATVDLDKTSYRTPITEADGTTLKKSGTIHNLFADVGADKWVAFMNGILIAAECDEE
ncbi:MAG: hypothetical protein ACR2NI_00980 [Pirellulales bacterium]